MNTILLTAGVVAVMAAIIGGGLRAFQIDVPVLKSRGVRVALGALGIAFLVGAILLPEADDGRGSLGAIRRQQEVQARNEQEAQVRHERQIDARRKHDSQARHDHELEQRFQQEVEATCKAVQRATKLQIIPGPGQNIDRDATLSGVRAGFAEAASRLQLLFAKPAPASLRHQAKVARGRAESYIRKGREFLNALRGALPAYPTLEQLRAAGATAGGTDIRARLEAAMTELAGRDCSLVTS